jgi:PAS domain S-box-containing protein
MGSSAPSPIEGLFEALAASAPDAILTIDEESTIRFANAAALRVFGYMPEELVGRSLLTVIPERLRAAHVGGLGRYLRTGLRHVPWTGIELRALRRDGSEIPVEISFGEFVNHDGKRLFSGFVRDVSERVRQKQELEAARATTEAALNELSRLGRITDVAIAQSTYEDMARELLVHLRDELAADDASVLLLDAASQELALRASTDPKSDPHANVRVPLGRGVTGSVAAMGTPRVIEDLRTADVVSDRLRSEFASLAAVPVHTEHQVIGVLEVASRVPRRFTDADIRLLQIVAERMAGVLARTRLYEDLQRANAELAARAREEHALRTLAQSITRATHVRDVTQQIADGAIVVAGATGAYVEHILSAGADVEIVAASGERVPAPGHRLPYPGSLTEELITRREPTLLTQLDHGGAAGAPYHDSSCAGCSVLIVPLLAERDPLGAIVLVRDPDAAPFDDRVITRVRTLSDLSSIALQRLVALAESERRRAEAEAAVRSRDEVLSIVSHDLRNPVSTVMMSASLLSDAEITLTEAEQRKQIEVIGRSAQRMSRLIQDLLDVARIEGGRLSIACRCEDAAPLVAEACEAFQPIAEDRSITLASQVDGALPRINVDRDRILQVLSNFLNNAMKFTPAGGRVTMRASRAPDGWVRYSVSDTGPGISEQDLPHVFDRFWQSKGTAHLGSGLGLAIAKGIVEAHGGRIGAESECGRGSTFWMELPISVECS